MSADGIPPDATEPVRTRPLVSTEEAATLARLFKVFANETRLRLLHVLVRDEEVCVGDIAGVLEMKPQAVSNQLQKLADRGIIAPRREGNSIYYHIVDPCVPVLLERGLCLTECCPEDAVNAADCCEVMEGCCEEASSSCCDQPEKKTGRKKNARGGRKKATKKSKASKRRKM